MNNINPILLIAAAIVAAAVILKLPIGPNPPGRYQTAGTGPGFFFLIDTVTAATWQWYGPNDGWRPVSSGAAR